ncbi:MAG TPA: AI-2E family transporter [Candidatus Limnocylindrales bacterium]|nr:AI-2E family transporter [Candidatus Limnocylindrales bacterium]
MRAEVAPWLVRGAGFTLGAALVVGLIALLVAAAQVLVLVFVAVLLGSGLEPIIAWMRDRLPIGRGAGILLVYAGFLALVVTLALLVVPGALRELDAVVAGIPSVLESARSWAAGLRPAALAESIGSLVDAAEAALRPRPPDPDDVVEVGLTVAEAAASIGLVLTIVFFWLLERARLQRYALAFLPARRRAGARTAWNAAEVRLGRWVRGQLTLMGAIGVMTGVAYTLLGVPSPLLLGLVAAICEAIPIVGPLLGAIPAIAIAATVSPELALTVTVVYVILQFIEGNLLVPVVMRNTMGISPFLVIVSLLIGGAAGGFAGALLAVPVAASVEAILERLQARNVPVAQDPGALEAATGEGA